jgi:hypothetical protein
MRRASAAYRRLLTIPGVVHLTTLALVSAIDDPARMVRSETSGPIWGCSPGGTGPARRRVSRPCFPIFKLDARLQSDRRSVRARHDRDVRSGAYACRQSARGRDNSWTDVPAARGAHARDRLEPDGDRGGNRGGQRGLVAVSGQGGLTRSLSCRSGNVALRLVADKPDRHVPSYRPTRDELPLP